MSYIITNELFYDYSLLGLNVLSKTTDIPISYTVDNTMFLPPERWLLQRIVNNHEICLPRFIGMIHEIESTVVQLYVLRIPWDSAEFLHLYDPFTSAGIHDPGNPGPPRPAAA